MRMEQAQIRPMSQISALAIADTWKYPGIYHYYDLDQDLEDYEEIIDEQKRQGHYFDVSIDGALIGYFSVYKKNETCLAYGLGLRLDLCGCGLGKQFVKSIEAYLRTHYVTQSWELAVAQFNTRALKTYQSCGYRIVDTRNSLQMVDWIRFIYL